MTRVDPRVRRTRELLVQAFFALLQERGFRSITVHDIAARATVNRATFYAHFADKYALLDAVIRERITAHLGATIRPDAAFTRANLHLLVRAICEHLADLRDIQCRPADYEQFEPLLKAVLEELQGFIEAWLRRLPPPSSPPLTDLALVTTNLSWAIFGAALAWCRGERTDSVERVAGQIVALVCEGLPRSLGMAGFTA